jgi:hypothetical protein
VTTLDRVFAYLRDVAMPVHYRIIAEEVGSSPGAALCALHRLQEQGARVRRTQDSGRWEVW